jgi:hypothetical protein
MREREELSIVKEGNKILVNKIWDIILPTKCLKRNFRRIQIIIKF